MNYVIKTFSVTPHVLPKREIYRYMGMRLEAIDDEIEERINLLMPRFFDQIHCKACWMEVPIFIDGEKVHMDMINAVSANLAQALKGCSKGIVFSATIGSDADRLCKTASISAPANAVILDAMGTTAIEWLCDEFCGYLSEVYFDYDIRPRFSPGYGDLPIALQRDFLRVLDAPRKIGLTLTDSLMLVPQKSVTAIVGLKKK